ncbi:MAG: protein kinase [Cyanothece sp. SIO1E1]|nr:protein kinase [Cyanothece sp. SIO1E1]
MQPPITAGTVLQNRYRLISILGQGGFGRTYLAEDLGRFNERCALKEFTPTQPGIHFFEKAKQLFQREAAILYQIQHPQVPQFRAIFEQDQRLFLVQDYVEGKTYRALLNERKAQGATFSEPETLQLMQQLLPVLAHIHNKGIIHRDITPDNVILRAADRLPTLIDFGVVKEVVTQLQSDTVPQATTVGKLGYAPSEQMQAGRVYPSSDLYSLAVMVVVLLTGQEPDQLFDDTTLTWNWQQWARVSPGLAQVLNRMLSARPGDRYATAADVMQALQAAPYVTASPSSSPVSSAAASPPPDMSQLRTMAVGRRADPTNYSATHPVPIPTPTADIPIWENPLAIAAIGTGLALAAGFGSWTIVRTIIDNQPQPVSPTPSPAPTVTLSPTPAARPSPEPAPQQPVAYSQGLSIAAGQTTSVEGTLKANETINYQLTAEQAQVLTTSLQGEGVLLSVLAPDGNLADSQAERVLGWQGPLGFSGEYTIQLKPVKGVPQSDYQLNISLANPAAPSPDPTVDETSEPDETSAPVTPQPPAVESQPVTFPAGSDGILIAGNANPESIKRYLVNARADQVLSLQIVSPTDGSVALDIRYPDGNLIEDASGVVFWQSQLSQNGDYQIDVLAQQAAEFTLDIRVRNTLE